MVACNSGNDSTNESTESSVQNQASKKSVETSSDVFEVLITKTEEVYADPQREDPICMVAIKLTNNTGKEVDLFQLRKYSVEVGDYKYSDNGSTYDLKNGESTTRAGIEFPHISCDSISEINIEQYQCLYKGFGNQGIDGYQCKDKVVFKGEGQIEFIVQ